MRCPRGCEAACLALDIVAGGGRGCQGVLVMLRMFPHQKALRELYDLPRVGSDLDDHGGWECWPCCPYPEVGVGTNEPLGMAGPHSASPLGKTARRGDSS